MSNTSSIINLNENHSHYDTKKNKSDTCLESFKIENQNKKYNNLFNNTFNMSFQMQKEENSGIIS